MCNTSWLRSVKRSIDLLLIHVSHQVQTASLHYRYVTEMESIGVSVEVTK